MIRRNLATLAVMAGTVLAAIALASDPQASDEASVYIGCMVSGHEGGVAPTTREDDAHRRGG